MRWPVSKGTINEIIKDHWIYVLVRSMDNVGGEISSEKISQRTYNVEIFVIDHILSHSFARFLMRSNCMTLPLNKEFIRTPSSEDISHE